MKTWTVGRICGSRIPSRAVASRQSAWLDDYRNLRKSFLESSGLLCALRVFDKIPSFGESAQVVRMWYGH
jgi:hypothetical protein